MRIAVLVASRNRPDLVDAMARSLAASMTLPYDLYVVECGTDRDKLSPHSTLWYADPDFRGKCWGHNLALQAAKSSERYDYYFVLHNDVVFEPGVDAARILIEQMERDPHLAILSPTNKDGGYPAAERRGNDGYRPVTTCDYLGFMMRASAEEQVGFLGAHFQYCWGAIHELSYKLYSRGWIVGYSDAVSYTHLGGSTYGQKDTKTISRDEYQRRAKRFAFTYFRETYGADWADTFWAATKPHAIAVDTFHEHERYWAGAFEAHELAAMGYTPDGSGATCTRSVADDPAAVRLHLGCGRDKRVGWINLDTDARLEPDVVGDAASLPMFADASVDVIEANHLFEHFTYDGARAALREWARVLRPGGELVLEMPDFDACVRAIGRHRDDGGYDLGMIGLYGWPPFIREAGVPQIHKWGWTRTALAAELAEAGLDGVVFEPIRQTWRVAAKHGLLLRLRAARLRVKDSKPIVEHDVGRSGTDVRSESTARSSTTSGKAPARRRFQLNTSCTVRVFAWPDWNDGRELERLFDEFARPLADREHAVLCLRRDPAIDPPIDHVARVLGDTHVRVLGAAAVLDVLIVDEPLDLPDIVDLEREITCAVALPSSDHPSRTVTFAALGDKLVRSSEDLRERIGPALVSGRR